MNTTTTTTPKPAITAGQVTIDPRPYITSHGKAPRGTAAWAFCPRDKWSANDYLDHVIWVPGLKRFSDACEEAKTIAAERGIRYLVVCS